MKKLFALLLVLALVLAFAGCAKSGNDTSPGNVATPTPAPTQEPAPSQEPGEAAEPAAVMTHDEYIAADLDSPVTVETYVQDKQSWWDDKANLYCQSPDGAYFVYETYCTEEDFAKLNPGTKIRVSGFKGEWAGEVEIMDPTFEFVDGDTFLADPVDLTEAFGSEDLAQYMNQRFSIKDGIIADKGDGAAFFYNWDNSGEDGSDLYFDVELNGQAFTFVVRRYLTAPGSDIYEAVKNLQVGDRVDIEGFLYWYEGPQPHITGLGVKVN